MSAQSNRCKVFLYKNDYNTICGEVYRHPRIETGGNLFGLWTTSGNVVVHVVLGPGEKCKRTDVSFHQDIAYLKRVGNFLNQKFMLCHIGEWHSHHHLSLDEPSYGDKRTVRDNYPKGMKKFLVIIGNLVSRDQVKLSPYFFTNDGSTCVKGEFEVLDVDSPFSSDSTIANELRNGAEGNDTTSDANYQRFISGGNNQSNHSQQRENSSLRSSRSQQFTNDHPSSSGNYANAVKTGTGDVTRNGRSVSHPPMHSPPDYGDSNFPRQPNTVSSPVSNTKAVAHSPNHPSHSNSATKNVSSSVQSESGNTELTLKAKSLNKVFFEIESQFGDSKVDMEGSTSGDIEMKFKHNGNFWLIRFPESFPKKAAHILCGYDERYSYTTEVRPPFSWGSESLNNYLNIILMIKIHCSQMKRCALCGKFNPQTMASSELDPDFNLILSEEGNSMVKELREKTESTIADAGSLKIQIKLDSKMPYITEQPVVEVSFKHEFKTWFVRLTSTFPGSPPRLTCKDESCGTYGSRESSVPLGTCFLKGGWMSKILLAITQKCCCGKCKRLDA